MNWIRQLLERRRIERDLDEEIQSHLEERVAALVAEGHSPKEALLAARREFGNVAITAERGREVWRWALVEEFISDLRYALRQFRRAPAFTAASLLTLALGIGANTAVFSIVNAVILQPLPFPGSGRLVSVQSRGTQGGSPHSENLSYPQFFEYRKQNRVFEHLVCYHDTTLGLSGAGEAINVPARIVSWDLLEVLRVSPAVGRGFLPEEEAPGRRVVILGDRLWKERFHADRAIVGQTIQLNRQPYLVVGVTPTGFAFPVENPEVQIWTTFAIDASSATMTPMTEQAGTRLLHAIGRLQPRVSIRRAQAEMDAVAASLAHQDPDDYANVASTWIIPEIDRVAGDTRAPILILLGAVGLVLLVACANVANLLLARTAERLREFAVRASIGAGRARVVRQLLTESLTLALLGSTAGMLLAAVCVRSVAQLAAGSIPRIEQAGVDGRVLAFSVVLAIFTSALFSLAPAVRLSRMELITPLQAASRGNTARAGLFSNALVVFQIALGLVLLSGAGLLASGFLHLMRRDPGFRPEGVVTFGVSLPDELTRGAAHLGFESRVIERVRTLPGVRSAAMAAPLPLAGHQITVSFDIEERRSAPSARPRSDMALVTPEYFQTLGIPVIEGRGFTEHDDGNSPPVLVVNRAFADRFFPGERVLGKRIEPGATAADVRGGMREIVGVVSNARQDPLGSGADPVYYFAEKQLPWCCPRYVVRTSGSVAALESSIRGVVASIDPNASVFHLESMDDTLAAAISAPRLQTLLLGAFALIAVLLTAAGLYGVLAYSVLSRTREIGIRVALGADRGAVLRMVLQEAAILVAIGAVLGLAGAAAGNRIARTMVYVASSPQPVLLVAACCVIVLTAALAAILPARRAAAVDAVRALSSD